MRFLKWPGITVVASIARILLGVGILLAKAIVIVLLILWLVLRAFLRKATTIGAGGGRQLRRLMRGAKMRLMRFLEGLRTAVIASMKGGARMRRWMRVFAFVSLVIALLIIGLALLAIGITEENPATLIAGGIILAFLVFWVPRCFRTVGSLESPAQAVRVRWGNPEEVLRPGLHIILWPVDALVIYPTKQFLLNISLTEVHSKLDPEAGYETALMNVEVNVYFAFPWGEDLIETFKRAPTPTGDLDEDVQVYTDHFGPAVNDALRNIMVQRNHAQCREEKADIEKKVKEFLMQEKGNAFEVARIPEKFLDVAITRIGFTSDMETSFSTPEIRRRTGEALAAEESRHLLGTMSAFQTGGMGRFVSGILAFLLRQGK